MERKLEWVECPRDAMQGLHHFIPTDKKIDYLNTLLGVGFDVLDFGSFVSPKAIPQLRDTTEVLAGLDLKNTATRLLAIVANLRGAETAVAFPEIAYIGFPFSISETFQQRNTNSSILQSLESVERMQELCVQHNKELVVYISMAFGNPYNDPWNTEIALDWTRRIAEMGVRTISLADTVGVAKPEDIASMFQTLLTALPTINWGAHLHCSSDNWQNKVSAAWQAGCRRFDTAMRGYGGCPMANDQLVGNLPAENFLSFLDELGWNPNVKREEFQKALSKSSEVMEGFRAT
jgi:hydroxymethylglutaryl-CoA lyase